MLLGSEILFFSLFSFPGRVGEVAKQAPEKLQIRQKPVSNIPGKVFCGFVWAVPLQSNQEENLCLSGELSQNQLLPFFSVKSSGASRFILAANKINTELLSSAVNFQAASLVPLVWKGNLNEWNSKHLIYGVTLQMACTSCKSLSIASLRESFCSRYTHSDLKDLLAARVGSPGHLSSPTCPAFT